MEKIEVKEAKGKLGILVVGVGGAVSSTFITGTLAVRKGVAVPIGSITQLGTHVKAGATRCRSTSKVRCTTLITYPNMICSSSIQR